MCLTVIWLFEYNSCTETDAIFLSAQDLQFVIKLSFHNLWCLRNSNLQNMSFMEVIQYYHPECKGMKYLEEENCRFLIIMDSFDCYLTHLDWEVSDFLTFAAKTISA